MNFYEIIAKIHSERKKLRRRNMTFRPYAGRAGEHWQRVRRKFKEKGIQP